MRFVRALIGLCVVCGVGCVNTPALVFTDTGNGGASGDSSSHSSSASASSSVAATSSAASSGGMACGALTVCGSDCVDTATDAANCGGCEVACATDYHCESAKCAADPVCCEGGTNVGAGAMFSPVMPDNYIAWPLVTACAMDVTQVEMFTNGGTWWIAKDAGGNVGPLLVGANLPKNQSPQWVGQPPSALAHLSAGQAYWIIEGTLPFGEQTYASVSEAGKDLLYRQTSTLGGLWVPGAKALKLAVRLHGVCP